MIPYGFPNLLLSDVFRAGEWAGYTRGYVHCIHDHKLRNTVQEALDLLRGVSA